jgi:GT2 family glycosyltransferase
VITLIVPTLDEAVGRTTLHALVATAGCAVDPLVVCDTHRSGYTSTVNRGLAQALLHQTDACVVVDDCVPATPHWLAELRAALATRPRAWFAGPSGACRTPPQSGGLLDDLRTPMYVSHVAGFCWLIKHEALATLGLLRAELEHYGSDVDYQWKARQLGGRSVWVPHVYMHHELHAPNQPAWERDNQRFSRLWR